MKISSSMNGLNSMKFLREVLVLVLMSLFPATNPAQTAPADPLPSVEFLEFLADWETDQGEWAGPEEFEDDSFDQLYVEEENAGQQEIARDFARDSGGAENAE